MDADMTDSIDVAGRIDRSDRLTLAKWIQEEITPWIDERCAVDVNAFTLFSDLYLDYVTWAGEDRYRHSVIAIGRMLEARGHLRVRTSRGRGHRGVKLLFERVPRVPTFRGADDF